MKLRLWIVDRHVLCDTIIEVSFAKVICLNIISRGSSTFPINFIKVTREQNQAAYDPSSLRSLGNIFNATKEEFEVSVHGRSVISLREGEFGPIRTVIDIFIISKCPIAGLRGDFGEINEVGASPEGLVVGAGILQMSASSGEGSQDLPVKG